MIEMSVSSLVSGLIVVFSRYTSSSALSPKLLSFKILRKSPDLTKGGQSMKMTPYYDIHIFWRCCITLNTINPAQNREPPSGSGPLGTIKRKKKIKQNMKKCYINKQNHTPVPLSQTTTFRPWESIVDGVGCYFQPNFLTRKPFVAPETTPSRIDRNLLIA